LLEELITACSLDVIIRGCSPAPGPLAVPTSSVFSFLESGPRSSGKTKGYII